MIDADPRRTMADYFRRIAAWRRQRAGEYDRDARNLRAAAGLDELADHVLALPADDERVVRLTALAMQGEEFVPGQQTSYEIGRFRFLSDEPTLDAFLTNVVRLAEADRGEQGRFGGRQVAGDDPWG